MSDGVQAEFRRSLGNQRSEDSFGSILKKSSGLLGSIVELDEVEELLMQEKTDFEVPLCSYLHFRTFLCSYNFVSATILQSTNNFYSFVS